MHRGHRQQLSASRSRHVGTPTTLVQTPIASAISANGASATEADIFSAHRRRRSVVSGRSSMSARNSSTLTSSRWNLHWPMHTHRPGHCTWQAHVAIHVAAVKAFWRLAAAAATRAIAGAYLTSGHRTATASRGRSAFANGYWQALHDASAAWALAGIHAVVGAEVSADHERLCSGAISC